MEQHSYWECIELPLDTHREELKNSVVRAFKTARVNVEKRIFYSIHRLGNTNIVMAKLVNQRDTIKILRDKKKLRELSCRWKQKPKPIKFMSMSPWVTILNGYLESEICHLKRACWISFQLKIKIIYGLVDEESKTEVSYVEDLIDILKAEIMQEIYTERNNC